MQNKVQNKRLVFGLGDSMFFNLEGKACPLERRQELMGRAFKTFDNDFLICAQNFTFKRAKLLANLNIGDRCYIDSGGFVLYKWESELGKDSPEFKRICETVKRRFLTMLSIMPCKEYFELDNEYFRADEDLMSPKNYLREDAKAITGFYPTPVFKMFQGFDYWKRLCESEMFPKLSIGGLAQTRNWKSCPDKLRLMVAYARACGKKVHFLGCQNAAVARFCQPDTVDYNIVQFSMNSNQAKMYNPGISKEETLKQYPFYAIAAAKIRSFLYDCFGTVPTEADIVKEHLSDRSGKDE